MKRIPVNLKDYQHKELRRLAYEEENNMSDHIRKAIDLYLKQKKGEISESNHSSIRP